MNIPIIFCEKDDLPDYPHGATCPAPAQEKDAPREEKHLEVIWQNIWRN